MSSRKRARQETQVVPQKESKTETSEQYLSKVGSLLECPVCFEHMKSPIWQCKNGHAICDPCFRELNTESNLCPTCRCSLGDVDSTIRCLALEHLATSFLLPCKFASKGCETLHLTKDTKVLHEGQCNHGSILCPLKFCGSVQFFESCNWSGTCAESVQHLRHDHKIELFDALAPDVVSVWINADVVSKQDEKEGRSLPCTRDNSIYMHLLYTPTWGMFFLPVLIRRDATYTIRLFGFMPPAEANKYRYKILLCSGDPTISSALPSLTYLSYQSAVLSILDLPRELAGASYTPSHPCLTLTDEMIRQFLTKSNSSTDTYSLRLTIRGTIKKKAQ